MLIAATTAILFSSCSKDEDTKPSLVGTWYIYQTSIVIDDETVHTEVMEGCETESNFYISKDYSAAYRDVNCNGYTSMEGRYDPELNQLILKQDNNDYFFDLEQSNSELLVSITYTVISDGVEVEETEVFHCKKGEPMPE